MNCPYLEPNCPRDLPSAATMCPRCRRFLKRCSRCGAANRAFANFCRGCSEVLNAGEGSWLGYKGGIRRLGSIGADPEPAPHRFDIVDTGIELRLGDVCRSLLGYDRHLVAVAKSGAIEIVDPHRPAAAQRFQAHGPVSAEPCIDRGILYAGSPRRIAAFSLGAMTLSPPRANPLWTMSLAGTPIQALTPLGDRLFFTVATEGRRMEVHSIAGIHSGGPPEPKQIHSARRMSWIAADAARGQAVFLSEDESGVQVHVATAARAEVTSRPVTLGPFSEQPIAFLGGRIFAVFDDARLYRIDPATGDVVESLDDDTQMFSLTHDGADEWDRDAVRIDSGGIHFPRTATRDTFAHVDRAVKGSPVIIHRRAAAVGMEDGRVLLYDLARPPKHDVWRLDGAAGTPITALASFDSFIAAGNLNGVVGVREIRAMAGRS